MLKITFSIILLLTFAASAEAQVKDSAHKDWTVYITTLQGKKVCYITSFPKNKSGNYKKRDEPYFMVTHIGEDVSEVSTSSGYKYKDGSNLDVMMGSKKLSMFTAGELAWAKDRLSDKEFISSMKKQNDFTVKGFSAMGSYSVDRYSLSGFSKAFDRMGEACK
jgi:hypothetical protein